MDSTVEPDPHQGREYRSSWAPSIIAGRVDREGLPQGRMRSVSSADGDAKARAACVGNLCFRGLGRASVFPGDDVGGEIAWSGGSVFRNG